MFVDSRVYGAPYEVLPLADFFKGQGMEVAVPTLPGPGEDTRGLHEVTYRDWLDSVVNAYQALNQSCEQRKPTARLSNSACSRW